MAIQSPPSESPNLDESVCSAVETLKEDFFSSLDGDLSALKSFQQSWTSFSNLVEQQARSLSANTLSLVYTFSETVETISASLLDWQISCEQTADQVSDELQTLLSEGVEILTLEDYSISSSPYVRTCAEWLLQNISNPYPEHAVREAIATQTSSKRKDVDNWFIDARKRIGWNALRKKHFNNKKADILWAANQFFGMELYSTDEIPLCVEAEFALIENRASDLAAQFTASPLAQRLDRAVKDLTKTLQAEAQAERRQQLAKKKRASSFYPTPDRSPESHSADLLTPSPSITALNKETAPRNLKRRASSSSLIDNDDDRGSKRSRIGTSPVVNLTTQTPPFPAASVQEHLTPTMAASQGSSFASLKRKRRLSDSTGEPSAKRLPKQIVSRPQAVSNPIPVSPNFDDWCSEMFGSSFLSPEIPPPVTVDTLDSTAPLEIELFNFPSVLADCAFDSPASIPDTSNIPATFTNIASSQHNIAEQSPPAQQSPPVQFGDFSTLPAPLDETGTFVPLVADLLIPESFDWYIHPETLASVPVHVDSSTTFDTSSIYLNGQPLEPITDYTSWNTSPISMQQPTPTLVLNKESPALSPSQKEAKQRELLEVQAKYLALCAELAVS